MARIPLEGAIQRALAVARPGPAERVPLSAAAGRVLATSLDFTADLPAFDHAAMDGYAISGAAAAGASFLVRGESRAGAPAGVGTTGEAAGISTGAALPVGLDTVVPWEDVERAGDRITLKQAARAGQHVRRAGEDARRGEPALASGTRLGPGHVALLAMLERAEVEVRRRPTVVVLATGDELREPGTPARPGSVVDSNGPMLAALVAQGGGVATAMRVPDRPGALEQALAAAEGADLIVTIGGAADGAHDHVAPALAALGAELVFRGVAIKPGKPLALATLGGRPLLALPGNPGSAFVTFLFVGLPLLRALGGEAEAIRGRVRATLAAPLRAPSDRMALVYGQLEGPERMFVPGPPATSGSVPGLSRATAIALVPEGAALAAGASVEVLEVESA